MSDLQIPEHPLEVLPAMVNLVVSPSVETVLITDVLTDILQLMQTGKVFRNRSLHDPKALGNTSEMLKKVIPKANERFHEALDEIELNIVSGISYDPA